MAKKDTAKASGATRRPAETAKRSRLRLRPLLLPLLLLIFVAAAAFEWRSSDSLMRAQLGDWQAELAGLIDELDAPSAQLQPAPVAVQEFAELHLLGQLQYASRQELGDALVDELQGPFWLLNLDRIKDKAEAVAWIDKVEVRRRVPRAIELTIFEQQPIARWHNEGLLNHRGEVFVVDGVETQFSHLPVFYGERQELSAMLKTYSAVYTLLAQAELTVFELKLDRRHSWSMVIDHGVGVQLGRENIMAAVDRLLKVYRLAVLPELNSLKRIDLRHSRGLAVI